MTLTPLSVALAGGSLVAALWVLYRFVGVQQTGGGVVPFPGVSPPLVGVEDDEEVSE